MEIMLISASAVSFVIAAGMSLIAWKLLREQDHRSAARVALLEFVSEEDDSYRQSVAARKASPAPRSGSLNAFKPEFARSEPGIKTVERDPWDLSIAPDAPVDETTVREVPAALFSPAITAPPSRRGQVAAVMVLMIAIGAGTVYALRESDALARLGLTPAAAPRQATAAAPMELLSLRHAATDDGTFVVTGLVQNPAAGRAVTGLAAVVYLFDKDGKFFATGRADVAQDALGPGAESAFVVRVPVTSAVTRYRVGFRLPDGAVMAHVDRRGEMPDGTTGELLAPEEPASSTASPPTPHGSKG